MNILERSEKEKKTLLRRLKDIGMASEKLYLTHLKAIKIEEIVIFMIRSGYNDPSKCKCWKLFRAILSTTFTAPLPFN